MDVINISIRYYPRLIAVGLTIVATLLSGVLTLLVSDTVQAADPKKGDLLNVDTVRAYLKKNHPEFLVYINNNNGNDKALHYKDANIANGWYVSDVSGVSVKNAYTKNTGKWRASCVLKLTSGYNYRIDFRIRSENRDNGCNHKNFGKVELGDWVNTKKYDYRWAGESHKGGQVEVSGIPPSLPGVLLIKDIDSSSQRKAQMIEITNDAIYAFRFVPDDSLVLDGGVSGGYRQFYSRGSLYTPDNDERKKIDDGLCDNDRAGYTTKETRCNVLIYIKPGKNYAIRASGILANTFILAENGIPEPYRTLKFDVNSEDASMDEDLPSPGQSYSAMIRKYANGGVYMRDYVRGVAAGALPIPTRDGYTFQNWYTQKTGGLEFKPTSKVDENMTVYAKWQSNSPGELTPSVDLDEGIVEPGETVDLIAKVSNSGGDVTADWRVVKLVLDPGVSPNKGADDSTASDQDPCAFYRGVNSGAPCDSAYSDNGRIFTGPSTEVVSSDETVPMDYGKTVCYGLAVNPYKAGGSWRYSRLKCFTIAKKPKVQVWGGNLSVGKSFDGTLNGSATVEGLISSVRGNSFGSWIEYSILAPNKVSRVGSGVGLGGGVVYGADAKQWNQLTYANTDFEAGKSYGYYDTQDSSLPDPSGLAEKYNLATGTVVSGEYDVQTLRAGANRIVKLDGSGNLTIRGAGNTLAKGEWLVVDAPDSDVVISDDISYANEDMASADDLPQLVIRAKNITINGGVTNIDAWLVAGDTIKTCDKTESLTVSDCSNQLRVNGPVISKSLVLARTGGDSTSPAEIFNLRPDAYLWMYNLASGHADYKVDYVRELPPRY